MKNRLAFYVCSFFIARMCFCKNMIIIQTYRANLRFHFLRVMCPYFPTQMPGHHGATPAAHCARLRCFKHCLIIVLVWFDCLTFVWYLWGPNAMPQIQRWCFHLKTSREWYCRTIPGKVNYKYATYYLNKYINIDSGLLFVSYWDFLSTLGWAHVGPMYTLFSHLPGEGC